MSSEAWVKFIKTKVSFRYHTKGSQTKFHQIRITKSKVIHVQILVPKWKKTEKLKKISGLQNEAIRGLQIGARGITNRGSFRDFKSGQKDYRSGQGFQIRPEITNRGKRYFQSEQGLQIGAEQFLFLLYFNDEGSKIHI